MIDIIGKHGRVGDGVGGGSSTDSWGGIGVIFCLRMLKTTLQPEKAVENPCNCRFWQEIARDQRFGRQWRSSEDELFVGNLGYAWLQGKKKMKWKRVLFRSKII